MTHVVHLENQRHYTLPMKNYANTREDNERMRAVLRREVKSWLNQHAPDTAVVLQRFEYGGDGSGNHKWVHTITFEVISFKCWLEFDDPAVAMLFKLRWC